MKKNILLSILSLSLFACGGGGGGGSADKGGFQKPNAPELSVSFSPEVILPNPSNAGFEGLSTRQRTIVTVYARQANTGIEDGETELHVSLNESVGSTKGYLYCFDAGNDICFNDDDNDKEKKGKRLNRLGKMQIDLASGRGIFGVTAVDGSIGDIGVNISVNGPNGAIVSKDILIPVRNESSGLTYNVSLLGKKTIKANKSEKYKIVVTDEDNNSVPDPVKSNVLLTTRGLTNARVILDRRSVGMTSVATKTKNGIIDLSILPRSTGDLYIDIKADAADNNVENGFQELVSKTVLIKVTDHQLSENDDIEIVNQGQLSLEVGKEYSNSDLAKIFTAGSPLKEMVVESGTLPPGMTLYKDGYLNGTPTTDGVFNFKLTVVATNGSVDSKDISVIVYSGSLSFDKEILDPVKVAKGENCADISQTLSVKAEKYSPSLPYKWTMGNNGIILDKEPKVLQNANSDKLTGISITVSDDSEQVTISGKACRENAKVLGKSHDIILKAEDQKQFNVQDTISLSIEFE